uniref:Uncharacterized protein n=1 Tax=Solanum lycopersicum TaxID=4081 RepID=A0A3Q7IQW7_SOLLC
MRRHLFFIFLIFFKANSIFNIITSHHGQCFKRNRHFFLVTSLDDKYYIVALRTLHLLYIINAVN